MIYFIKNMATWPAAIVTSIDVVDNTAEYLRCCECCLLDVDYEGLEMNLERWPFREMYRLANGAIICEACLETLDFWE